MFSKFNTKASLWIKGRKTSFSYLEGKLQNEERRAWFHVSSLGEFEQGRPVMEAMKEQDPSLKIVLTFFSPSGYEIRKNYKGADYICYLPIDTPKNARRFVELVNPELAVFVKYEYWYHYLKHLHLKKARLILISAIFRPQQPFFKWYGGLHRKMLGFFEHLFIQNKQSAKLLENIGVKHYSVAGDSRFDRVKQIASDAKGIECANKFAAGHFTLICGSTWEPDEDVLCRYINETQYDCRLIIAPHEIHAAHIEQIKKKLQVPYVLFSNWTQQSVAVAKVLIIDNIGMLSSIYRYGRASYIGGGFGAGIHNTLEAAVYGIPVLFGPKYQKFQEAVDLVNQKGAFSIQDYDDCKKLLDEWINNSGACESIGQNAGSYVEAMAGATAEVLTYLTKP